MIKKHSGSDKPLVDLFIQLVSFDSPTGKEDKLINFLYGFAKKQGLKTSLDSFGNLYICAGNCGESLFLGAHADTVQPGEKIIPVIRDGTIYSSGETILGADNKVAIAAILDSVIRLKKTGAKFRKLEIVITKSEEIGTLGAINIDRRKIMAKRGYIFDNANPIGTIIIKSPYYFDIDAEIVGREAHSSRPDEAINVLNPLKDILSEIKLGKVSKNTLVNLGVLNVGMVRNAVPGNLTALFEIRSFTKKEANFYLDTIVKILKSKSALHKCKLKLKIIKENSGYEHKPTSDFLVSTSRLFESLNIKSVNMESWACSDGNIFNNMGMNVINLGNGSKSAHTRQENISVKNLILLRNLVTSLIIS